MEDHMSRELSVNESNRDIYQAGNITIHANCLNNLNLHLYHLLQLNYVFNIQYLFCGEN